MALSLSCPCGISFEVEDTFADQVVTCPECHSALKAPAVRHGPRHTSGYAIASLVLALVGAFTLIGTLAAVLCGLLALITIARSRGRLAGVGFALSGLLLGILFTLLTAFAYSTGELFGVGDQLRTRLMAGRVDFTGPLEIVQPASGFAISRPSEKWGVARKELMDEVNNGCKIMLVNPGKDAFVDVSLMSSTGLSIDDLRQQIIASFQASEKEEMGGIKGLHKFTGVKVRDSRRLEARSGAEVGEIELDVKVMNQPFSYLIQVVKKPGSSRAYLVRGWVARRRYPLLKDELERVVGSLRLVD